MHENQNASPLYKFEKIISALLRWGIAFLIGFAAFSYISLIVRDGLDEVNRLTLVELGIILLAGVSILLLIYPDSLGIVKLIEVAGVKLQLEKIQKKQQQQEGELETMRVMLPLLLPRDERAHLINLEKGKTQDYEGNSGLRQNLRRLRSAGLIQMRNKRFVGELKDKKHFDLADYVELTPDGKAWLERIKAVEKEQIEENHEGTKS